MTGVLHISFTGSRAGMSVAQKERLWQLVGHRTFYFHHGLCKGADAEADAIVRRAPGLYGVIMHPGDVPELRASIVPNYPRDVVLEPRPCLERDQDIVDASACLIAASKTEGPVLRSGTWATIRMAVEAGKPVCVIYPSGALNFPTPGVEWSDFDLDGEKITSPGRLRHG